MSTEPENHACENCRFWEPFGESFAEIYSLNGQGRCRRRAPRTISGPGMTYEPAWPRTSFEDWCGDFKPNPEHDAR